MVSCRFFYSNAIRVIALLGASVVAWYLGYLFAEYLPEDSVQAAVDSVQQLAAKPVVIAPPPKTLKCTAWRNCLPSELLYQIRCGGGKSKLPLICLEGQMLMDGEKLMGDRGINFVIISDATLKVIETKTFDMYEGDFSGKMVEFINTIPDKSIILVASHDDASTKLSDDAKKAFENLGSKEIRNIMFRSGWVFLARKGSPIPEGVEREKIIHSDNSKNRYSGWPSEIQIDGCLPRI